MDSEEIKIKQEQIDQLTTSGHASDVEIVRLTAEAVETGKTTDATLLASEQVAKATLLASKQIAQAILVAQAQVAEATLLAQTQASDATLLAQSQISGGDEIDRLNAESEALGKVTDAKLLAQGEIISELKDQRIKNQHDRNLIKWLLFVLMGLGVIALVGVGLVIALSFRINTLVKTNQQSLDTSSKTYAIIKGCTQPGNPCFESAKAQGNQQITDALTKISNDLKSQLDIKTTQFQNDLNALLAAELANRKTITFPPAPTTATNNASRTTPKTTPTTVAPSRAPPVTTTIVPPGTPQGQAKKCGALGLGVTLLGKCLL